MNPDCPFGGCDRSAGNTTSGAIQIHGQECLQNSLPWRKKHLQQKVPA